MSQQNIEVAREAVAAWNAGEMDRLRALYDPDAVMGSLPNWPEPGPFLGREAIMRQFSSLRETYDTDTLVLVGDALAAGDRVVLHATWRTAGRGPATEIEMAWVYTVRGGLIVSVEFFWDHREALEAAGIAEQTPDA